MKMTTMHRRQFLSGLAAAATASVGAASAQSPAQQQDWPQWRGPKRDGISPETGLLASWPSGGPKRLWQISNLGEGYGSLAIAGDRIYVQGRKGNDSVVFALNRTNGAPIWFSILGPRLDQDRGPGPRSTPTVDGEFIYAMSENGDLSCIRFKDGSSAWKRNVLRDFRGENPNWNLSESPLIDGNNVIVTPGGRDACIVALDKTTGKNVWTSKGLSDGAGYSSCIVADVAGVRTIMNLTAEAGVGVRASDGKLMWRESSPANGTANCTTPVLEGNRVFYTSAYGTGCTMLELTAAANNTVNAEKKYFNREMQNHHGGVVVHKGHVYGFSNAILTCMELATGRSVWKDRSVGKGSITLADGKLYLLGEGHVMGLAEATPAGYKELGRFQIEDQGLPSWAHPVVCGRKLYIRNQGLLSCYDVKA
ncbi:polyvinyl alcohol dehydrogenase [Bryobacterales bacterium F-183]|nr:polyvinyl alcohol dehydrogenase [Bryobacterales bacterium F-183]